MPVYSARSNNRGGRWRGWPAFFLLLTLGAGVSPCPAMAAGPVVDGTPTKQSLGAVASFATSFPAGFGSANVGDCCIILCCGNTTLSTASGCAASGSGWTPYTFPVWNASNYTADNTHPRLCEWRHSADLQHSASGNGSENLLCYKGSNSCAFANWANAAEWLRQHDRLRAGNHRHGGRRSTVLHLRARLGHLLELQRQSGTGSSTRQLHRLQR